MPARRHDDPAALAGAARGQAADRPRCSAIAEILDGAGFALPRGLRRRRLRRGRAARRREPVGADPRDQGARRRRRSGIALRGRFLVGSRPVGGRHRAAASSPARPRTGSTSSACTIRSTTSRTCARPARRSSSAGKRVPRRARLQPGPTTGETDALVEQARKLPELGATRVARQRSDRRARAAPGAASSSRAIAEASGLPVGFYCPGRRRASALADRARGRRAPART